MKRRSSELVVEEVRRRAAVGRSLRSGDNRGDWLYPSAVRRFGSWGAAVEAAGFDYDEVVSRPMTADAVLAEIVVIAASGDVLRRMDHRKLGGAAIRHFGSWARAVEAAGCKIPDRRKWTPESVVAAMCDDLAAGLPMGANAARRRNENLYAAARRRLGSWKAAVAAAAKKRSSEPPTST